MRKKEQPIVIFSTDDYLIPQSSSMPKYQFFFQIIKDGSIVGKLNIKKKEFHLIGRVEDLCDIFIDNPSVSRKHAILQFHKQDPLPSLFDLGSAQGTFVNKQRLPPKAYKKLQLYSNIKFGVSSRYYLLRCPQLEQKLNQQEEQKQNEFVKVMAQQNTMLSKQQAKARYLQLLENDPYFGGQLKSRKFQGEKKNSYQNTNQRDEGISWGIGDESQVYAYKNQRQFPLEPDVIRRLPGLDHTTLQKIAQYQEKFRMYDEIQAQLNELSNKQKKQYGLQEKLQGRKEKLEKRFLQSLQALQQSEDWIRVNLFGDQNTSQAEKKKKKEREMDSFEDDQFYDRTLESKKQKKDEKPNQTKKVQSNLTTVQDLWMLKNSFISELTRKKELLLLSQQLQKQVVHQKKENQQKEGEQVNEQGKEQPDEQPDEFEMFMKQNEENLEQQNKNIYSRQIDLVQQKLKEYKQKLLNFLSEKQITRLEEQTLNPEKAKQKEERKKKKQAQEKQSLSKTLSRLQAEERGRRQKSQRRRKLEQQCTDEYSQKIFDLYKEVIEQVQQEDDQDDSEQNYKRPFDNSNNNNQNINDGQPRKIIHTQQIYQTVINQQPQNNNDESQEQKVFDLTKNFQ